MMMRWANPPGRWHLPSCRIILVPVGCRSPDCMPYIHKLPVRHTQYTSITRQYTCWDTQRTHLQLPERTEILHPWRQNIRKAEAGEAQVASKIEALITKLNWLCYCHANKNHIETLQRWYQHRIWVLREWQWPDLPHHVSSLGCG